MQFKTTTQAIRALLAGSVMSTAMLLHGCGGTDQDITLNTVEPTPEQSQQTPGSVIMDFANGNIPFPHNALFSGSSDGTLNIPVADPEDYSDPRVAMNAVDGFSTSAPITFSVSKSLDTTDANGNQISDIFETGLAVYEAEITLDPDTGARVVTGIDKQLQLGLDYIAVVADAAAEAKSVAIVPLRPLASKTTYLVVVNNAMSDSDQVALSKGLIYQALSSTNSLEGSALAALEPLRQLTNAHLSALANDGVDVSKVVGSWSFTTQSTSDVLQAVSNPQNSSFAMDENFQTDSPLGAATIYRATLDVPYFGGVPSAQNPIAPLNQFWQGQGGSMLSQFNPSPVATTTQSIPVLFSAPKDTAPEDGWPVVIFQHGITQNRANLLAVADSLAKAGFAAVAIDMPLHGITEDSQFAGLRDASVAERTFGLDIDGTEGEDASGSYFINLRNLVVTRDNLRQAVSDLMQLRASLTQLSGTADSLLDGSQISFASHSLGAMVGGIYQNLEPSQSAVFAMPGTQAAYVLASSGSFGPMIAAGLAEQGIAAGSAEFQQFLLAAQTVVDSADPVNYVAGISAPSLLFEVVGNNVDIPSDQTIPNAVATAPLAGTEAWIGLQSLNALSPVAGQITPVTNGKGVMRFTAGDHSSILSPEVNSEVTTTMQEAMASFLATGGAAVQVSSSDTVQ